MAKIIVLDAMKGGVGKFVSTYNLAHSLNKLEKKVLVVDFDSSANITRCVVEDIKTVEISSGDLMMNQMDEEEQPNPAEYIINRKGADFIPSLKVLAAVDVKLRLEMGAEKILAYNMETLREKYDYILIDTCPSLNTLTINALAAADEVIIAVNPQFWVMVELEDFLLTVKKIKNRVNSKLDVSGILLTMCEKRTNLCKVLTDEVAETFNGKLRIFDSKIPTTVNVGESVYYGDRFRKWAERIGINTYTVVNAIRTSKRVEQQTYRSCMGLLKLAEKYSDALLEAACKKALSYTSSPSYKSIKNILVTGSVKLESEATESKTTHKAHGITRGADYYRR